MSSTTSWILLGACTVLLLTPSLAMMAGWIPGMIRHRPGPVRLLGAAGIALYGAALCEFVPRLADADEDMITAGEYGAVAMCAMTAVMGAAYDMLLGPSSPLERGQAVRRAAPGKPAEGTN
ncbi:hypothetical protein [Streptomyces indicus]|uniref:Uncharacterized protein n=1 Tax=Streptomyces indicus TaxID=417292 RepID=A0A1G9GQH8_9ACTN|nr:hypothetical protein [Streptomyces indicus]SDL02914.1 hypothetical protein SAMN05421806_116148 [Streptomyces indicus]